MKILEAQSAVLSNPEVLMHIRDTAAKSRSSPSKITDVETILKEVTDYLVPDRQRRSPIPPYTNVHNYDPAAIRRIVHDLQEYKLTKGELLMIVNLRPLDSGMLDCIVEDVDERLSAEQQEQLLATVKTRLGDGEAEDDPEHLKLNAVDSNGAGTNGINGHEF